MTDDWVGLGVGPGVVKGQLAGQGAQIVDQRESQQRL